MSTSPLHSTAEADVARPSAGDDTVNPHGHTERAERLLTTNEVADWLGVSKAWVYDHVTRKRPRLPCIRFGEVTRFRREEIERFIEEHANSDGISFP